VIHIFSTRFHFSVIDKLTSASSLYSKSIQDHLLAILIKTVDERSDSFVFSIDLKATDSQLASNLMKEIESYFTS